MQFINTKFQVIKSQNRRKSKAYTKKNSFTISIAKKYNNSLQSFVQYSIHLSPSYKGFETQQMGNVSSKKWWKKNKFHLF